MSLETPRLQSRRKLASIRRRFEAINRQRLQRLEGMLTPRQQPLVQLLPLLFHTNHTLMPGFVSGETPKGISSYVPDKSSLQSAARLAKSFEYRHESYQHDDIDALYLMGSTGTVGYSDRSDLDIWLCHRPALTEPALTRLQDKAKRVTDWADSLGLQVHFFITTAEDVREGRHESLSAESSGSAQHHLLLDEFYRTALLLAGRHPLWWLVPPEEEHRYDECASQLLERQLANPDDVVDFGGLSHVPASEFFGATLWHLYKGIGSPHKSLLKLVLLEAYASEYPDIDLLSLHYKRIVFAGEHRPDRLDPYRLMLEKVESYLSVCEDKERLELARRSFYIKTGQRLSRGSGLDAENGGPSDLQLILQRWQWSKAHLQNLDDRDHWKVEEVMVERRLLVDALTRGYRFLSAFVRDQKELASISQEDMNVLGRRLFAAFERKAGKIEVLGAGNSRNLHEPHLAIRREVRNAQESWLLSRTGVLGMAPGPTQPQLPRPSRSRGMLLKRSRSLLELIAWCHFNGIANSATRFSFSQSVNHPTPSEVSAVLRALEAQFPRQELSEPTVESLTRPSRVMKACAFINITVDPLADLTREGKHLTSNNLDPLNFAGQQENLAQATDYVLVTSWQEAFVFRFEGTDGLMACLGEYMQGSAGAQAPFTAYCFSPGRGHLIAARIQALFQNVAAAFAQTDHRASTRYILKADGKYLVIHTEDNAASFRQLGSEAGMLRYLAQPSPSFSPVVFDPVSLPNTPLARMYELNKPGAIQVFLQTYDRQATVYVIDEKGSLFRDIVPCHSQMTLINQYDRFLTAVVYRLNATAFDDDTGMGSQPIEFYGFRKKRDGSLQPRPLKHDVSAAKHPYVQLQVISELVGEEVEFTFYCDGTEFSTLELGNSLFSQVAEHVQSLRRDKATHPIYITDIDLTGMIAAGQAAVQPQTVHYLHYKKSLESRLNEVIAQPRLTA